MVCSFYELARFLTLAVVVALAAAMGPSASAAPVLVDDFDLPNPYGVADLFIINQVHPNPYVLPQVDGGIPSGGRTIVVTVVGTPRPFSAVGASGEGSFAVATFSPAATIDLGYTFGAPLDLTDGGSNAALEIGFERADGGPGFTFLSILAELSDASAHTATYVGDTGLTGVPESGSPFAFQMNFSDFVLSDPGFDWSSISTLDIRFNDLLHTGVDFEINYIAAVIPEPSSLVLAALGMGLAGVFAYRRRRGA